MKQYACINPQDHKISTIGYSSFVDRCVQRHTSEAIKAQSIATMVLLWSMVTAHSTTPRALTALPAWGNGKWPLAQAGGYHNTTECCTVTTDMKPRGILGLNFFYLRCSLRRNPSVALTSDPKIRGHDIIQPFNGYRDTMM